jgi:hypothetical protein
MKYLYKNKIKLKRTEKLVDFDFGLVEFDVMFALFGCFVGGVVQERASRVRGLAVLF